MKSFLLTWWGVIAMFVVAILTLGSIALCAGVDLIPWYVSLMLFILGIVTYVLSICLVPRLTKMAAEDKHEDVRTTHLG